jgi:hypothetical protein
MPLLGGDIQWGVDMKGGCLHLHRTIAAACLWLALAAVAAAADGDDLKPVICKARATCRIAKLTLAGKSDSGVRLAVAEVALGLADKPADAPEDGCRSDQDNNDGGREYWLVEGGRPARLLLKLCNDGYGAAGVGVDQVEVGDNRLTHIQYGGSNDRWETTSIVALSPPRSLRIEGCGFRATDPNYASFGWVDIPTMAARSLAIDDAKTTGSEDTDNDPCDLLRGQMGKPAKPGFLAGIDIPLPAIGLGDSLPVDFARGTTLGGCAARVTFGAGEGHAVFGQPDPGRLVELRLIALNQHALAVQIQDPRPDRTQPKSWVAGDHLEIWTSRDLAVMRHADPEQAAQIGIGLDGKVYAGVGKPSMPKVERWAAVDEQNRPARVFLLDWPDAEALDGGATIAYSEAEGGRQARILATGPIARNRPRYLPGITQVPVACGAVSGRWEVTSNPGSLEGVEIAN